MSLQLRELNRAITAALAFGSVAALTMAPAFAQDDEDGDTAQMETVEVTGSRIKRTDAEGSVPVTVIDRQQLELSGDVSVADYLHNTTFNSFVPSARSRVRRRSRSPNCPCVVWAAPAP